MIICGILLGHLVFGFLLMDYLCPNWHPFEKLVGAAIWPVSLAVGIGMMVSGLREDRKRRAIERHSIFHLKSQFQLMDILAGLRKGMWE